MTSTSFVSRRLLLCAVIISLIFLFAESARTIFDSSDRVVFCDVGQGDGAYIRSGNTDIVVDTGERGDIFTCLGEHMGFLDRSIDVVFITHLQADHAGALSELLTRYTVDTLVINFLYSDQKMYDEIKKALINSDTRLRGLIAGDVLRIGETVFVEAIWPQKEYLASFVDGYVDNSNVLGVMTKHDLNSLSLVIKVSVGDLKILFTGDIGPDELYMISQTREIELLRDSIDILKVPHHGSKNGLTPIFLDVITPRVAIISAGKNNRFGHPSKEVVDMIHHRDIVLLETGIGGSFIFKQTAEDEWLIPKASSTQQ